jgi:putative adhesin
MGKRELLLIVAFAIAGAIVYQVTAPAPAPGERSFSPGRLIENIRRGMRGNRASADVATTSTEAIDAAVTELRVLLPTGELTIAGEDRQDLGIELEVHSTGYDDAEAQRLARETIVKIDRAGGRMIAEAKYPQEGRQTANLTLHVPSRLQFTIEPTSARTRVAGVGGVELSNSRGESEFKQIAGRVSGNYRGGELRIADARGVKLTTIGTDVRLEQIRGDATLNMRSGELRGSEIGGPIDLDTIGTDIFLEKLDKTAGILRINAVSGSVSVKGLRTEGRIDVRGADVDVVVERAAPLAIYAEGGDPIEITPPAGGYQLDAVASDGSITLPPGTLEVATTGQEHRATGPVNGGGPTITIRSAHGNITVRSR